MEAFAEDLKTMQRTPLADEHVAMLRTIGEERWVAAGVTVFRHGEPMDAFYYCEEGEVEVVDPVSGERAVNATIGPTQFLGDITFLSGGVWSLPMRTVTRTRFIVVSRDDMLALMARVPEIADLIVTVYAARRRRTMEEGRSALTLIGVDQDRALREVASFVSRNRVPASRFDLQTEKADRVLRDAGLPLDQPAVLFGHCVIDDPTPRKIARLLGLDLSLADEEAFDVVIVGSGPAGIAAAVYAGAEGLRALVVEDSVIGGQAGSSSRIENYMGFPTGISGADLTFRGEIQAMRLGTRFIMPRKVEAIEKQSDGFCLTLDDDENVHARAVVIATGVQYRRLPLNGLERLEGQGVYYAATDLEARWCAGSEIIIIGGGNSAGQAAMFLSRTAKHAHVLVRGEALADSMSAYLSSRLEQDEKITVHFQTEATALHGDASLEAVTISNRQSGEEQRIVTPALFVMVGAAPNTGWIKELVELDEKGFVITGCDSASPFVTSVPGIFAVGDVRAGSTKRVASGVGEGSVVIAAVWAHVRQAP